MKVTEECTDDIDDLGEDSEPMDKCIPSLRIIVMMTYVRPLYLSKTSYLPCRHSDENSRVCIAS